MAFLFLVLAGVNSTVGNMLLKKGAMHDGINIFYFSVNLYMVSGIFFYAVNVLLFSLALKSIPVSIGYPILAALGSVLLVICSSYIFDEAITLNKMLGILIIIVGITVLFWKA